MFKTVDDILEALSKEELIALQLAIPQEIKSRVAAEKEDLADKIIELYSETNSLGRSVYTVKEIAIITTTKEYLVAEILREYKKGL